MADDIERIPFLSLAEPLPAPEVRLSLTPGLARRGVVDGGWWPRSRDAAMELAELVADLTVPLGMITRFAVDARDWDDIPRRIKIGDRMVRVGWFPGLNHMIIVTRGRQDEFLLLVVPPDAPPRAAQAALELAAAGTGTARPQEVLAGRGSSTAPVRTTNGGSPTTTSHPHRSGDAPALRLVQGGSVHEPHVTAGDGGLENEPAELARWLDDGAPQYATDR